MTQRGSGTQMKLHPVEVSEQGYPMLKEPWRKSKYGHGFGLCCDMQEQPMKCEHQRNGRAAYAHLRKEPPEGATHDVYGYLLPLPSARKTRKPT